MRTIGEHRGVPPELHAVSGFSFLEGASDPEDLVAEAARLGYEAIALCDRDSLSGAPRFFSAARKAGVRPLVGASVSLDQPGLRKGTHNQTLHRRLTLLAENRRGYQNLCRLLSRINTRAPKGEGRATWADLDDFSGGLVALLNDPRDEDPVRGVFGRGNVYVELNRHLLREQERQNQVRIELARSRGLPLLAANAPCFATPARKGLQDALTCLRFKKKLDEAGRLLEANAERYVKPPKTIRNLFRDLPEAVDNADELGRRLEFTLQDLGYEFPRYPLPPARPTRRTCAR